MESLEIKIHKSANILPPEERTRVIASHPKFGEVFTDHMLIAQYDRENGWHNFEVTELAELKMHPASHVIHYGQSIFEGMKAYHQPDGSVATFRPRVNAERFAASARRLAMPPISEEMFLKAIQALVETDRDWVPTEFGESLYLRPIMFSRDKQLLTKPSATYTFVVLASPVANYFQNGVQPVNVWASREYIRAAPGGTGEAKCAGNYAAGLAAQQEAIDHGCEQVIWLDAHDRKAIEEMGGMNVYFVFRDGDRVKLVTPQTTGTILKGVTRDSILTLAQDCGFEVEQRRIELNEWKAACTEGLMTEAFACGTAAIVVPIGRVRSVDGEFAVGDGQTGPIASMVRNKLLSIQHGLEPDTHGWLYPLLKANHAA
ncbi:branched-chain amino acid aminotransferase [Burkholderia ambifaria]|uniref:branched-chain amino acid aminotransferase n=1 Tax=Burkholderia ambifaria TaxID=152480 RepID=UPI001B9C5657|nr:branched-chain amino acid aminotransferase [Burkholderia ambifaria]MBR8257561.1 branched-chain amino acid aminotransferase [Burkholderia ambifaria]